MKRFYILLLAACIMLSFVACGNKETDPTESSGNQKTTAATISTAEPTASATVPTATVAEPNEDRFLFFKHYGVQPFVGYQLDLTKCVADYLYVYDKQTEAVIPVYEGPIVDYVENDNDLYFVKLYEPTKIYAAPILNAAKHTVIYESAHGAIDSFFIAADVDKFKNTTLQFTEGSKRLVWLDLTTGKAEVMMEQYYIQYGSWSPDKQLDESVEKWQDYDRIYFVGKLKFDDPLEQYLYYRNTGEIEVCTWQ